MALPLSGNPMSLNQIHVEAGGTSNTQVSINDADIRGLTAATGLTIPTGNQTEISLGNFFGATSIVWEFSVTAADSDENTASPQGYDSYCIGKSCSQYDRLGYSTYGDRTQPSNNVADNYGSTTDTTCDFKSGAVLKKLNWEDLLGANVTLELAGSHTNAGFTTMTIGSTSFSRSSATYSSGTNTRINETTTKWVWATLSQSTTGGGNPFPYAVTYSSLGDPIYTPTGASSTVTFT